MKKLILLSVMLLVKLYSFAQETFPINGVKDVKPALYALINAKIISEPDNTYDNATLIIRGNQIENIGPNMTPPKGAIIIDLQGKTIYPSFIDMYSTYGMPTVKKGQRNDEPQFLSNKKGAYSWNEAIRPEINATELFSADKTKAEELRKLGFGNVLSFNKDGIARGTSVFVSLNDKKDNEVILKDRSSTHYSFSKGSSTQDYPSSLMGSIALLRQTFYDAQWYKANAGKTEFNISLDAINKQFDIPQIFETNDVYDISRAQKIANEFGMQFIYKVSGTEYQRLADVKKTNASLIVSMNFPKPFDVEDYFDAQNVGLTEMKNWELAPFNASMLEKEKIRFALTLDGLKNTNDFWKNLRIAIKDGLSEKQALSSLTIIPAQMLKLSDKVGSLRIGMDANFIITSGNVFKEDAEIYENWVMGERYVISDFNTKDIRGDYNLTISGVESMKLSISGELEKPELSVIKSDSTKAKLFFSRSGELITIVFNPSLENTKGKIRLSGSTNFADSSITLSGEGTLADGTLVKWSAKSIGKFEKKDDEKKDDAKENSIGPITYPLTAFGWKEIPTAEKVLIKNATVWTNEKDGKLENTDVLIDNGKIVSVGKNLSDANAKTIDGTGKHLTSGIIDEHSHIAISRGVNESAQNNTAEVRIGDVLDPTDIDIYRQLAGGVTTSQLLHGSANPIGGQSAIIKLRWGKNAEEMKFEGADGFIKFALGENVKQSNWGENNTTRFPQTRMGVEQVYIDAFTRAKEYENEQKGFDLIPASKRANLATPRKDLELDALVEILNKKRFITCHSYVQSEINMLMKVGDTLGFKVNTFTHILEGYKVADKMKARGIGAGTFSDWWAYKYEVIDAIPYNGAILNKVGVVTAFNSDDAEMARRLNQEAGKAIRYGGVSEEDAWKFVTLNPAKLLHLDNRVGSVKAGKDADLVLWSDNPLSIYAKAEKTFVDGVLYYDIEYDKVLRTEVAKERERLIQKMLDEKKIGSATQKPEKKEKKHYTCNDIEAE